MTVATRLKQTLANLKGAHGTMMVYATQARHGETRAAFSEAAAVVGRIVLDLEKRIGELELAEPGYKGY